MNNKVIWRSPRCYPFTHPFCSFCKCCSSVLLNAKIRIFAHDIKLYLRINSFSDCLLLQVDHNQLLAWSKSFGLSLYIQKCSVLSFFHLESSINFPYPINKNPLKFSRVRLCPLRSWHIYRLQHDRADIKEVPPNGLFQA